MLIFANGDMSPGKWVVPFLERATVLIAADGGLGHVRTLGRTPDVVIGDFDSAEPELLSDLNEAQVEVVVYPQDKDATDLQLALEYAVANSDDDILIFGALGGRIDQMLSNVLMLTAPILRGREVRIVDEYQQAWVMDQRAHHF